MRDATILFDLDGTVADPAEVITRLGPRADGIDAIGVTYGAGSREEIQSAELACIARSVGELATFVLGGRRRARVTRRAIARSAMGSPESGWARSYAFTSAVLYFPWR